MKRICIVFVLFWSCRQNVDIVPVDLRVLKNCAYLDDAMRIEILESFESSPCKTDTLNANVYQVKLLHTGDTIYVFEICHNMIWTEDKMSDLEKQYPFVVLKEQHTVNELFVPWNANIHVGSKFLIGSVKKVDF